MDAKHQPPGDEDDERKAEKNTRRDAGHPNEAHRSDRFTSMTGHNQIVAMKEMSTRPERTSGPDNIHKSSICSLAKQIAFRSIFLSLSPKKNNDSDIVREIFNSHLFWLNSHPAMLLDHGQGLLNLNIRRIQDLIEAGRV
jgi:hypothetical protein